MTGAAGIPGPMGRRQRTVVSVAVPFHIFCGKEMLARWEYPDESPNLTNWIDQIHIWNN